MLAQGSSDSNRETPSDFSESFLGAHHSYPLEVPNADHESGESPVTPGVKRTSVQASKGKKWAISNLLLGSCPEFLASFPH